MTTTTLPAYTLPMQRDVALFHDAVPHPNRVAAPGPLPLDRIELRIALIREEGIDELRDGIEHDDIVEIIDALVDTLYVSFGALVEMGWTRTVVAGIDLAYNPQLAPAPLAQEARLALLTDIVRRSEGYLESLEAAFLAENEELSAELIASIITLAKDGLAQLRVDSQPFFDEVQRSNMSKMGPDGKGIRSRGMELDGLPLDKAMKGPNYSPPDLAAVYERLYGPAAVSAPVAPEVDAEFAPGAGETTTTDLVSPEFERGARAAAEAMRFYFLNENEASLYDVSTTALESFENSAIRDTLRDEQLRRERGHF
jgi:predicted HAD superfamily Cof-like phosphohydrolase